jgi:acetate---CoA ligase (ADP-forming)
MIQNLADYRADALLRDGISIQIRAIREEDRLPLAHLFRSMNRRSAYFKWFGAHDPWTEQDTDFLAAVDFIESAAIVAVAREAGLSRLIGVARYCRIPAGAPASDRAEAVFAVAEDHQGRGVGTLLLEHLVAAARSQGIRELQAEVLKENVRMLRVLSRSGYCLTQSDHEGVIRIVFPTEETREAGEARLGRCRRAIAQSMLPLLNPRSIAIVGASRQSGSIGHALIANALRCGFKGTIYPVNPKADEIEGLKAFPSVGAIGAHVDLAVISVPAPHVEQAMRDCALAGVRGAVVISSGFGEVSAEGRAVEKKLHEIARNSGMRLVGPNSMGLLNADPAVSLNATFVPAWPVAGTIGIVSQSGALGYVLLLQLQSLGIGVSSFVSVGNKADVNGSDLLASWAEDPATTVLVYYLESFDDPGIFARLAPEIVRKKPVVALKAGRSAAGTRAASSHSAALASPETAVNALFAQAGVLRAETIEELLDISILLSCQPIPAGPRVGIITNGGGPGILMADECESRGLKVPEFAPETVARLRSFLPSQAGLTNPVDMIASATGEQYGEAMRIAGADPNIDALAVIYLPPQLHPPEEVRRAIAASAADVPAGKPVLLISMSSEPIPPVVSPGLRGRIPAYGFPENAARALAAANKYGQLRQRPTGSCHRIQADNAARIRRIVDGALEGRSGPVWLSTEEIAGILEDAGIEFAPALEVSVSAALETAEKLGFPLVLKIQSDKILHKSDIGGVILGLQSMSEVATALERLKSSAAKAGVELEKVLVQREIRGGIETLVGVSSDPTFGPLVVCGAGGVLAELLKDVEFRLAPVTDIDAAEMIAGLKSVKLLDGYRGAPAGDRAALEQLITKVSAISELVPELKEMDLNPVKVLEPGKGAVVVDARIRIGA